MHITYADCLCLVNECKAHLLESFLVRVISIGSNSFVFYFQKGGMIMKWVLFLEKGKCAFFLSEKRYEGTYSHFTKKIIELFGSANLKDMTLIGQDRVLQLLFEKGVIVIELFPAKPKIHVFNLPQDYKKAPLSTQAFSKEPSGITSIEVEKRIDTLEEKKCREEYVKELERRIKKAENGYLLFEKILEKGFALEENQALLLKTYYYKLKRGDTEITLEDFEGNPHILKLDPRLLPEENLAAYFKRAKKAKKAFAFAQEKIEEKKCWLEEKIKEKTDFENRQSLSQEKIVSKKKDSTETVKKEPFMRFFSASGALIYVGRDAKNNDLLTLHFAKPEDLWLHVSSLPGSHVVVRGCKENDRETLLDALELALHYSKSRGKSAEIIVTEKRYVSKQKKAPPGQVTLSQFKRYKIHPDLERLKRIRERGSQVPDPL